MSSSTTPMPGYVAGCWEISSVNSELRFTVRHLGVAKVHGRLNDVTGTIITGDPVEQSSVTASVATASVDTGFPARDTYIRGSDVLASDQHTELRFASTLVRFADESLFVDGDLSIGRITRPVTLRVDVGGFAEDPVEQVPVLGLSATATLRRTDIGFGAKVPTVILGEDIAVELDILAVRSL